MSNDQWLEPAGYTFKGAERVINKVIRFVFYYRLAIVFLCTIALLLFSVSVWESSVPTEKLKNLATVLTCGSIIIAIFYSILNYEYTQIRFKHDKKTAKEILTFNIASEWHKDPMAENIKIASKFLKKCKPFVEESNAKRFHEEIENEQNEDSKKALLALFNYFESISLGVKQGIMDEDFIKGFFSTAFQQYFNQYSFYIEYRRKVRGNPKIWNNFTTLANNWLNK